MYLHLPIALTDIDPSSLEALTSAFGCLGVMASIIIGLTLFVFSIYCHWRICAKAGYSAAMSLLILIPGLGTIVLMIILAFGKWPIHRNEDQK
jgi:uncharacterized membrane protein YhaH (DUF805 family)